MMSVKSNNIHVLSTDKPSRVLYNSTLKSFCIQKEIDGMFINDGKVSGADFWGLEKALNNGFQPQNIYITSDEEIKEGDWIYGLFNSGVILKSNYNIKKSNQYYKEYGLKIILTTDQDLIKDGVQAIDDEFLKWFVNNHSCKYVEVIKYKDIPDERIYTADGYFESKIDLDYKIIIPIKQNMKETIKEVAERRFNHNNYKLSMAQKIAFIEGAKWQQERMYSEEFECVNMYLDDLNIPRKSEDGQEYSIVGRIKLLQSRYLKQMSDVESHYLSNKETMYSEEDMRIAYLTNPNHLGTFEEFIKEFKNK